MLKEMLFFDNLATGPSSCIPHVGNYLLLCYRLQGRGTTENREESHKENKASSSSINLTMSHVPELYTLKTLLCLKNKAQIL